MTRSALKNNFVHRHIQDMLVVLEGGDYPLLLCPKIDKFPPWVALNGRNWDMAMCDMGGGEETQTAYGRGITGNHGNVIPGLWQASQDGH